MIADLKMSTCSSEIFTEQGLMVLITSHKAQFFLHQATSVVQMKLVTVFSVRNQAKFCNEELSSENTCQKLKYMRYKIKINHVTALKFILYQTKK